jgi:hypothetical protein
MKLNKTSKFFSAFLMTSLLVVLVISIIFISIQPDPKHYYQGSMLKLDLLKTTSSPRIIVTGGSNIAFGIDSKLMGERLGLPVINHGLVVGLGVAPVKELRDYIRPGDIIIISLEYYNFSDKVAFFGYPNYLSDWIEFLPKRIKYLPDPVDDMPNIFTMMLQRKVNRQLNYYLYGESLDQFREIYTGDQFNSYGDFTGHLNRNPVEQSEIGSSAYPINILDEAYVFLAEFNRYATSKGARVYYEPQPNRQINCEATGDRQLERFYKILQKETAIPVLTPLDQLCLPNEYFFDTPYHLNAEGRKIRTVRLIDNLSRVLNSGN